MMFPQVQSKFHMIKNDQTKSVRYAMHYDNNQVEVNGIQLIHLMQQFYHFTQLHEIKVSHLNVQLVEAKHMMTGYYHFNIVDNIIQDVYAASDEAHNTMTETRDKILKTFSSQLQNKFNHYQHHKSNGSTTTPIKSTRFPHVKLDNTFCRSPNPYDTSTTGPDPVHPKRVTHTFRHSPPNIDCGQLA